MKFSAWLLTFVVLNSAHAFSSKPNEPEFSDSTEAFKKGLGLSQWLGDLIESKHYSVTRLEETSKPKLENVTYKTVFALAPEWMDWLKKQKVRVSTSQRWKTFPVPAHLALPQGRPTADKINTHVFVYTDSVKRQNFYFLKADTTSSCDSGCSPIVFSVVLSQNNSDIDLIPDPQMPLKKLGHQTLNQSEIKLLQSTLNSLDSLYKAEFNSIQHPQELTSSTEQTWAPYKKTVVNGGAYTSYRVYEAALVLIETIKRQNMPPFQLSQSSEKALNEFYERHSNRIGEFFRVKNTVEANDLLKSIRSELNSKDLPASIRGQLQRMTVLLKLYPFWSLENTSSPKFLEVLRETQIATRFPDLYCQVFLSFASRHKAKNVFRGQTKKLNKLPCGDSIQPWFGALSSEPISRSAINAVKDQSLPEFLKQEKTLLLRLAQATSTSTKLGRLVRAQLQIQHGIQSRTLTQAQLESVYSELKESYLRSLRPDLGPLPSIELPSVDASSIIPLSNKRIYVFFQSWCSTCKTLLSTMREGLDAKGWAQIQLIETQITSDIPGESYMVCLELNLPEQSCDGLLGIPQKEKFESLRNTLQLQSVPRIIVTDTKGNITDFGLELSTQSPELLKRQIQWALEAQ